MTRTPVGIFDEAHRRDREIDVRLTPEQRARIRDVFDQFDYASFERRIARHLFDAFPALFTVELEQTRFGSHVRQLRGLQPWDGMVIDDLLYIDTRALEDAHDRALPWFLSRAIPDQASGKDQGISFLS